MLVFVGFSEEEYNEFYKTVLAPLQSNVLENSNSSVSTTYVKGGSVSHVLLLNFSWFCFLKTWQLAYARVTYETIDYVTIATVPDSDVEATSTTVQKKIDLSVNGLVAAFVILMCIFAAAIFYFSVLFARAIVTPINELKALCLMVTEDDLAGKVPDRASSLDMRALLDAFSNLIVALRFGSDSYARGNKVKARAAFSDALELYTVSQNERGIASAHNNLGAVELDSKHYAKSRDHFCEAIKLGETRVKNAHTPEEIARLKRVLSDRRGNLALLHLEEGNFGAAYELLESLLHTDKELGYILGCVVKQGLSPVFGWMIVTNCF